MLWILAAAIALVFLAGAALLVYLCRRRAVPDPWAEEHLRDCGDSPYGKALRGDRDWFAGKLPSPVEIESDDGLTLRGQLLSRRDPRGTVLLFHGYRGSWKRDFAGAVRFLWDQGFQLLLADGRAHGRSQGRWITLGVWERFDVRAWAMWAEERFGGAHPVYLYGVSMGGAAALLSASLELPGNVRGIIADSAYSSPQLLLERTLSRTWIPAGPALWLLNLFARTWVGFGLRDADVPEALRESSYPVLLIHGTEDRSVAQDMARRNYDACRSEKRLLTVEGAGHGMCYLTDPPRVEAALREFFDRHTRME